MFAIVFLIVVIFQGNHSKQLSNAQIKSDIYMISVICDDN